MFNGSAYRQISRLTQIKNPSTKEGFFSVISVVLSINREFLLSIPQ